MTHLLSKVVRQTRLIALYGLTGTIIVGLLGSFYMGRDERSVSTLYQTSQANEEQESQREVGGDCLKTEMGTYDCTDSLDVLKRWRAFEREEITLGKEGLKRKQFKTILKDVCRKHNLEAPCEDHLIGMATVESGLGKWMVGDGGKSHGWYHIQTKLHNVSMECANSLLCSTEWTVNNLIKNGYKTNPTWALGSHNSKTPKWNAKYVAMVNSKMK